MRLTREDKGAFLAIALCVAALLPFINKPFHIDDPMYLWAAKQIRAHPLDPYGFEVNWGQTSAPMADIMKNPPGVCYYLAAASFMTGWSEAGMHAALLLPAIGVILGTYVLAKQVHAPPTAAALATLGSPVFLLSATTVMADVLMLCFFVWAIVAWVAGMRGNRVALLFIGALLATLAALTKYFGIALIPLLLAHGLLHRRGKPGIFLIPITLVITALAIFNAITSRQYGHGLVFNAAQFAAQERWSTSGRLSPMISGLTFTGGCCATIAFVALATAGRRAAIAIACAFAVSAITLLSIKSIGTHEIRAASGLQWSFFMQLVLWMVAGAGILALAVTFTWKHRTPEAITLALWIAGTFIFATFVNWIVAGRSILPMVPAAAVVAASMIPATRARRAMSSAAIAIGGTLGICVTIADTSLARTGQLAAAEADRAIHRFPVAPQTVWFCGHWGFQEYMQQLGGKPVDAERSVLRVGDAWVEPRTSIDVFRVPEAGLTTVRTFSFQPTSWLATMSEPVHAGFYLHAIGPLPFAFGPVPPQFYRVCVIKQQMSKRPVPEASAP